MIRPLVLALLIAGPVAAEVAVRPVARPVPEAPLRPEARPVAADAAAPAPSVTAEDKLGSATAAVSRRPLDRAEAEMQPVAFDLRTGWQGRAEPDRSGHLGLAAVQPMAKAPASPPPRPHMPWRDVVRTPAAGPSGGQSADTGFTLQAVAVALRPPERPPEVAEEAQRVKAERARGQVCSTPELQGEVLGTVAGPGSCGVENAVRIRSVAGVRLSAPATMDCTTARSLLAWVQTGAIPAVGSTGGGLVGLRFAGHYACRGRNNVAGARLSEHSFGRAVDISAFQLRDGSEISVLRGWGSGHGDRLRQMWRAACGPFGTVLGPDANAAHRDHFHFDTARYRAGSYCR